MCVCIYIFTTHMYLTALFSNNARPGEVYGIPMRKNSSDFKSAKYGIYRMFIDFPIQSLHFQGGFMEFMGIFPGFSYSKSPFLISSCHS